MKDDLKIMERSLMKVFQKVIILMVEGFALKFLLLGRHFLMWTQIPMVEYLSLEVVMVGVPL